MTELRAIPTCEGCPIRLNAVCADCGRDELAALEAAKSYRRLPAGATLVEEGEIPSHFSSIVSGSATVTKTLKDGRRQYVGILLPSDYIGRPGRHASLYEVRTLAETLLCQFERGAFERLLDEVPRLAPRLIEMTFDELDAARELAVVLGRKTARERVASLLVSLARRSAKLRRPLSEADAPLTLHLPLSRGQIADHLGLTIETASRQMAALKKDGVIGGTTRDIAIPNFRRLLLEAGSEGNPPPGYR